MGKLAGKIALITGGARGMGAQHVRRFIAEGAKVVFTDILEDDGARLASQLGNNAKFTKHDVTSEDDWIRVVNEVENTFGHVNILVNNAGIVLNKPIAATSLEEFMRVININQLSVFLGLKHILPSMKAAGSGSIINVSSMNGLKGTGNTAAYSSSKFGVRGLSQSAALEYAPFGIRVNSIHPGAVATPMLVTEETRAAVEQFAQTIPLKRVADPDEVSSLVVFLASDESSYCTGSEFSIDGGALRR